MGVFGLFWKGRFLKDFGSFATRAEADTVRRLESQQMEFGRFSPKQMDRFLKVKKVR